MTRWYIEDREFAVDRALVIQVLIDFGTRARATGS